MKADLHMHSTVSDGSFTMEELADAAVSKGMDVIGITDHDTVSHLYKLPVRNGLRVIGGVEISAYDEKTKQKAHILGYNVVKPERLAAFVNPTAAARDENCRKQICVLQEHGYRIDTDEMKKADGIYIYKQHIMEYLCTTGQVTEMFGKFYQQTFKNGGICDFDITYPDPFSAVRALKDAGALAVLAHSGQQQNFDLIPELVSCGLDGLEYSHPSNSVQDKKQILAYAENYGLFLTGGSDFHGKFEKDSAQIGNFLAEEDAMQHMISIHDEIAGSLVQLV